MRAPFAALAVVLCASLSAEARVSRAMGRTPKLPSRVEAPKLWVERSGLFSLQRPESELWRFDSAARDGNTGELIPLVVRSEETGAQLSVQSADGVPSAQVLCKLLAERLAAETRVRVDDPVKVMARGGDAYAFTFTSGDESRGRVAVAPAGDHFVLIVASWPLGSPAQVAEDVDSMIASVGPAERAGR